MSNFAIDTKIAKANKSIDLGRYSEAEALFVSILEKFPNNSVAAQGLQRLNTLRGHKSVAQPTTAQYTKVVDLLNRQKFGEAISEIQALLVFFPVVPELFFFLGTARFKIQQTILAIECYQHALRIRPDYVDALVNLGVAFRDQGRLSDAIVCYEKVLLINPKSVESLFNLANVQVEIGDLAAAASHYKRAIELSSQVALMHSALGHVYNNQGEFTSAIECFEKALHLDPEFAECYRNFINAVRREVPASMVEKIRELFARDNLPASDHMHLAFALAVIEEDRADHAKSMEYLRIANKLRKTELSYSISSDEALYSAIKTFFKDDFQTLKIPEGNRLQQRPVFILGMPRSGTTLTEQIVSSHSKVHGAGELGYLGDAIHSSSWLSNSSRVDVLQTIRSRYLANVQKLSDSPIITDKMPANFRWIGFILHALPEAKIVYLKRDPAAVCLSNFKNFYPAKGMGFTFDLEDVARYYVLHQDLMEFWEKKFPGKIHILDYEKLTEEPETEARKLFKHLDLEWEDQVLDFHANERSVKTASLRQVRKKMYKGSSQEWKKYEPWIGEMLEILKPVM